MAGRLASLFRCCGVVVDEAMLLLLLVGVPGLTMLGAVAVVLLTLVVVDEAMMLLADGVEDGDKTVLLLGLVGGAVN